MADLQKLNQLNIPEENSLILRNLQPKPISWKATSHPLQRFTHFTASLTGAYAPLIVTK